MTWDSHPETQRLASLYAQVLRDAMEATDTSVADLASRLGLSRRRVRYMVSGNHAPTVHTVARALETMGYRLSVHPEPIE